MDGRIKEVIESKGKRERGSHYQLKKYRPGKKKSRLRSLWKEDQLQKSLVVTKKKKGGKKEQFPTFAKLRRSKARTEARKK